MNLAYRMRPQNFEEFVGQADLVGKDKILRKMLESKQLSSMILWGPPGSGKTTLAHLVARATNADFHHLSAVEASKADLREIVKQAEISLKKKKRTILFIDEIHRWNKAQQDALLPYVESGLITLIGATTENPSFEVISALLSRTRIFVLKSLEQKDLEKIIDAALTDKNRGLGKFKKKIDPEALELLIRLSGGDARIMLNALEMAVTTYKEKKINIEIIKEIFQTRSAGLYDKKADEHYTTISSYIKSMRASNVDASLYYLARMVEGGEDPKFIARRMVIFASEDIGMALPTALVVANAVFRACETIGYPECVINLAHGTVYLAKAKKDRSSYDAYNRALEDVKNFPNEPIPLKLRNAPTKLMKNLDYGKDYEMYSKEDLLPEKLKGRKYYKEIK
ncbi:MAG TPA: replication-associated recombination protein A [Candidatus Saccharimonadales bacterium]|nr:replication-associated recombination protein A [Candidatus Saccharimonadales bacterium]